MALQILAIPALQDNYIWLLRMPDKLDCVVVDPGDAQPVMRYLAQHKLRLSAILVTHHHWDHTAGIDKLLEQNPVPVFGSAQKTISCLTHPLKTGDQIHLLQGNLSLQILEIPGHTQDHIAYYSQADTDIVKPIVFCGDTLFGGGCGRIFEGTAWEMYQSLTKLSILLENTQIYCAHEYTVKNLEFAQWLEPHNIAIQNRLIEAKVSRSQSLPTLPSLLSAEKLTNPFLRCDHVDFIQSVKQHFPTIGHRPLDIFSKVRLCKDEW